MSEGRTGVTARAVESLGGYWVYWQTPAAYGSRGHDLDKEQAEALAEAIRSTGDINAMPRD